MSVPKDYIDDEPDLDEIFKKLNYVTLKFDNEFMNGAKTLINNGFVQTEIFTRPDETGNPVGWALFVKEELAGSYTQNVVDEHEEAIIEEIDSLRNEIEDLKELIRKKGMNEKDE